MRTASLILIVILVALACAWGAYKIVEASKCSFWHSEKCDVSCTVDEDCHPSACSCVNIDESVAMERGLFVKQQINLDCVLYECQCVEGQCEALPE